MRIHTRGRGRLGLTALTALTAAAALAAACSGSKDPEPLPSQTISQVTPRLQPPPPPAPAPIRRVAPTKKSTVKVIDAGGGSDNPKTLVEASRIAKAQKAREGVREPIATITDENLHEYAQDGEIIVLDSERAAPSQALAAQQGAPQAPAGGARGEDYWRTRALELRMGWRRTLDRIGELELESAALRQQFYAEEDTYLRDSQIKPAWDRVLDLLEDLRGRAGRYEQELEVLVEEGRSTGALAGWLNQGWELEPTEEERDRFEQLAAHQSIEPPILDDDDGEDDP